MSETADPNAPTQSERQRLLSLYERHLDRRAALPLAGKFMEYGWGNLPNPLCGWWMAYSEMFNEFAREIANTINSLTNNIHRLSAWAEVIADSDDQEKLAAAHEFIDATATTAMNLPHVIQARFIFAAGHLCHQANLAKQGALWRDDFPVDRKIDGLQHIAKYGEPWSAYANLRDRIERIYDPAFQAATNNFRNVYHHRFPQRFVIGVTNNVRRIVNPASKAASYAIGGREPFQLTEIVPLLVDQATRCYEAFDAFKVLVREHEAAIAADNALPS